MKKVFFIILFSMILSGVYGQTRAENRWMLGRWVGEYRTTNVEIVLNDNGTGRLDSNNIVFSIIGNSIAIFHAEGGGRVVDSIIYRISDQRMVLIIDGIHFHFTKRN